MQQSGEAVCCLFNRFLYSFAKLTIVNWMYVLFEDLLRDMFSFRQDINVLKYMAIQQFSCHLYISLKRKKKSIKFQLLSIFLKRNK